MRHVATNRKDNMSQNRKDMSQNRKDMSQSRKKSHFFGDVVSRPWPLTNSPLRQLSSPFAMPNRWHRWSVAGEP
jgi:hypothetical protein